MVKVCAMVLLAVGAAASRSEGTALLQTQNLQSSMSLGLAQGEERNSRLFSMKEQVLAFAQAGVPEGAKTFLRQIERILEDDILKELTVEKNATVKTEANNLKPFSQAEEAYNNAMDPERNAKANAVSAAKNTHTACRRVESQNWTTADNCNTLMGQKQKTFDGDVALLKSSKNALDVCQEGGPWASAADGVVAKMEAYSGDVETVIASRKDLDGQKQLCREKDGELSTQKQTCDGNQKTYEDLACTRAQNIAQAAITYKGSYNTANETIQANWNLWKDESASRVKQCQLVKTIVCYVQALEQHDDKVPLENAITACDEGTYDCDIYAFEAEQLPAEISLDAVPAAPCDGFDYGDFPANTAKADTCTRCTLPSDPSPTPAPTPAPPTALSCTAGYELFANETGCGGDWSTRQHSGFGELLVEATGEPGGPAHVEACHALCSATDYCGEFFVGQQTFHCMYIEGNECTAVAEPTLNWYRCN